MPNLTEIGEYAFYGTKIEKTPDLSEVGKIGAYAFSLTRIRTVEIADKTIVGEGAFYNCELLQSVTIGSGSEIGVGAFANPVYNVTYEALEEILVTVEEELAKELFYFYYTT